MAALPEERGVYAAALRSAPGGGSLVPQHDCVPVGVDAGLWGEARSVRTSRKALFAEMIAFSGEGRDRAHVTYTPPGGEQLAP